MSAVSSRWSFPNCRRIVPRGRPAASRRGPARHVSLCSLEVHGSRSLVVKRRNVTGLRDTGNQTVNAVGPADGRNDIRPLSCNEQRGGGLLEFDREFSV